MAEYAKLSQVYRNHKRIRTQHRPDRRIGRKIPFVESFGIDYRAIAYSRRYNFPNGNPVPPKANHSTAVEAADLAEFITKLKLPKAHVVGCSYGGYTALHLAVNHPEMIRTLVLAEPPLLPWLADMSEHQDEGQQMLMLQETRFVNPARRALNPGKEEEANMFAPLSRQQVAALTMPILMMSGEKSIGPLRLTDAELAKTLPQRTTKRVIISNATHGMWYEDPTACTSALSMFFREH